MSMPCRAATQWYCRVTLDTYKDADEAHRDSIMAHLELLKQNNQDWTNAVVSGSKEALEAYLQKYPNSLHKQEALIKIDSSTGM